MDMTSRWRQLLQELRPTVPPGDMRLYVSPGCSSAEEVVRDFLADPSACPKFLLVGARGGGKSTELRAVAMHLGERALCASVDLDASGVNASAVTAFDLLYVSALALLRTLPAAEAKLLFDELALRYAGEQHADVIGDFAEALAGLADFAHVAGGIAAATPLLHGAGPTEAAIGGALALGSIGLRLMQRPEVVAETSPRGRGLQETCVKIARAVRARSDSKPLCVLIDGLEKINGEATERFRQVFEQTRLVADTHWASVIAAPPCTLTETSSVDGRGFITKPVWGFGPDPDKLEVLIARRFEDCDLDPTVTVVAGGLRRIAEMSGGLPRYAIMITREAVTRALADGAPAISREHLDGAITAIATSLGRGLNENHLRILARVAETERLPGDDDAATLFADGRILAYAPRPPSMLPRFAVHPLLIADVRAQTKTDAADFT